MTAPTRAAGSTTGFLEESPGNRSAMRLMCLLALLASIGFAAVTMVRSAPMLTRDSSGQETLTSPPRDDTGIVISFAFLLAAFAPKVLQKFAEQRLGDLKSSGLRELVLDAVSGSMDRQPAAAATLTPTPTEDPRLRPLLEEVERLRAEIERSRTPIQVSAATPVPPPAPALTPLERIRLGGSL
ncbi:hypothetical protein [Synechococcus sp. CCY 0621]|uniref:hypothetical protein n=1 Tax=Synechococcus sp. CCY 0621 TaxID=2815603 RepID=UPI001C24B07E|nr:hypothetical protein [Synechococcus sp. CCY 0621]